MKQNIGTVVISYGRQYIVEYNGDQYQAVSRAKKTEYVVGDKVLLNIINAKQAQILDVIPRNNLVYRSDQNRQKLIASNVDQILIIIAVKPNFNIQFLNNILIFAEYSEIRPIIVINKSDLAESNQFIITIKQLYEEKLGYKTITTSMAGNDQQYNSQGGEYGNECDLRLVLQGKASLLLGQSGVGKSTMINHLLPNVNARTGELAHLGHSGAHTTTNATLYHLDNESDIVDCPGMHEFGIHDLSRENMLDCFPEMRQFFGKCKFNDCRHINEPGCIILQALQSGLINQQRYNALIRCADL